ncbi:aspartic proteinase nepenthesin-1-like [Lolium rigidum]|uniref:aspartic proteinase nepenthesin-1-like n=1 Tax=Lolium rigidum TaxID=89674 RepID=UPI001F5D2083|nr:aspartic proteinase nepenthesin-1-like [Lolium rigidum]
MKNPSVMLPCVLFLAIFFARPAASTTLRADLTHVDSGRGFTKRELLTRMAARSTARAASLGASAQAATAPVASGGSEYLVHLGVGTPSQQAVALVLDTGSDLIWTQCACTASNCYQQALPVFKPSASGTFGTVSCTDPICGPKGGLQNYGCSKDNLCRYGYSYGDKSFTIGTIIEDTFTFSGSAVPSLRFGCGMKNGGRFTPNESGIAGFGRGPLSLPSQLNVDRFSYCLTTIGDQGSSTVFLGTPDNLGANAQSTPFAPTPATGGTSSFYYLSLQGVSVGKTLLPLTASRSDGPIIDSGTSITIFPEAVFQSLREAFVSQVPLPVANASASPIPGMLCFSTAQAADPKKVPVPKLILHLEGADWDIPTQNYLLEVEDDKGNAGALLCVVILSAGDLDMTIIGNFQQQNTHIVYDLQANKMNFAPASCDQL